jgi:phosphohistidine phosphatase
MKSLHLLRHAKSSWKDPGLNDHDRPLSKRGRQTAKMMAAYLRRVKIAPDLVICSTAMRAQQTLDPIAKAKKPPKVVLVSEIYGGAQRVLWGQLWNLPESAKSVLLIGHNPALHDLALELAHADLNKLLPSPSGKFPTGAMASFCFDGAWEELEPHGAVLTSFITPKAMRRLPGAAPLGVCDGFGDERHGSSASFDDTENGGIGPYPNRSRERHCLRSQGVQFQPDHGQSSNRKGLIDLRMGLSHCQIEHVTNLLARPSPSASNRRRARRPRHRTALPADRSAESRTRRSCRERS